MAQYYEMHIDAGADYRMTWADGRGILQLSRSQATPHG